jgi:hypothetical protein
MATLHQAVCTSFEPQAYEADLGIYQKAGLTPVGEVLVFDARPLV